MIITNHSFPPPKSAVLLIIYNRPQQTAAVMEAIRQYKPTRLYVVADGPRGNNEAEASLCSRSRTEASTIDWDCELFTLFRDNNLGCAPSVVGGINWFFEHEELGIILEDDCVPSLDFFSFTDYLLQNFRDDARVGMISGMNRIGYHPKNGEDYFFTTVPNTWGWATWRRAWKKMDFQMSWREERGARQVISRISPTLRLKHYWKRAIRLIDGGKVNAWDWQWYFSLSKNKLLTLTAAGSLVTNIGFDEAATHTKRRPKGLSQSLTRPKNPPAGPQLTKTDVKYARAVSRSIFPDERPLIVLAKRAEKATLTPLKNAAFKLYRRIRVSD